ncbi:S41 family peptidase [Gramella sp. GC03-9]|uniref:Tricorn protease homolog n=1 Tax=Christiangramia oceanisediminis TaxID=2920386 RepID=A0A9X2KVD9_9FLAO|nr:S41 family peptidase [Gramella oceanisediminis]MCP9198585.1 S41 family peptidase [Gramella oceanisediminis]
MKIKISFLFLLGVIFSGLSQEKPNWIRYQSISPDAEKIVFTYKGNLYTVPVSGGDAKQITFHDAHDYMPVWSKDGKKIAFASNRYGNFDIFVMNANGGEATRLTYHSNDEEPYTFSADDQNVIFGAVRQDKASHRQYPTSSQPELYSVPVQTGRVGQVFTIPAEKVQVSKDGKKMIYHDKKGYENEWRKHHVSSITRDIWIYDKTDGSHKKLTEFAGEDRQPVFSENENSIFYLSEEDGNFNVFKLDLENPAQTEQLTSFKKHPVRFLSQAKDVLSFGYDGELYTMKTGEAPKKVAVSITTQTTSNTEKYIKINGGVDEMAISPNGKEIAFIARGEVFVTSVDGALTKRITNTPAQERFVSFTPDGKSVAYARESEGKWTIFKTEKQREEEPLFFASTLLDETKVLEEDTDVYLPEFSPDSTKMAYISDRRELKVRDLESGKTVQLLNADDLFHMRDGDKYFQWSPDSKWLLVSWGKLLSNQEILLLAADGSKRVNLTESGYQDFSPKWANNKQMLWFSNRNGLKSYATSGRTEVDVYSMFFTTEAWDEFQLNEEEFKLAKQIEEMNKPDSTELAKSSKKKKKQPVEDSTKVSFDWDGLKERKARLTIHSGYMADAVLSKDGEKLYYLAQFEDKMNLWETNLRNKETKMLVKLNTSGGSLKWDNKKENLYLLSEGNISKIDLTKGSSEKIKISGDMTYDELAERENMLEHVYIRTKNAFYEPTYHGTAWDSLYQHYKKYLPSIGNSYEFTEMLSEMLGELNVSHSGARYSEDNPNGDETASLGIFMDYSYDGDGIRIEEVLKGGPLDKSKFNVKPGTIITRIEGIELTRDHDIAKFLNRKNNQFVLLEMRLPDSKEVKQITVKPISLEEEGALLYKRFVRINEEEVEKKSDGKLGYVHIPGMSDEPYRSIYEDMMGKYYDKEAVIVDTRFNGGGDLVADLASFFTGTPFITYATSRKVVGGEPTSRWTKPTVSLYNESMYSDGHCYASAYENLDIGTTIGMPVPGTCSFAGWEGLPNGTRWGMVPVSAKDMNGEWMENNQTTPDIIVKNAPERISEGQDQQLEKAIEVLLDQVEQ